MEHYSTFPDVCFFEYYHSHALMIPIDLNPVFFIQNGYQLVIEALVVNYINAQQSFHLLGMNDYVLVEIPASALGQFSSQQTYYGKFYTNSSVTINLSYSLGCSPNYTLFTVSTVLQCVRDGKSYTMCVKLFSPQPLS